VTCNIGSLAVGAAATITIVVNAPSTAGTITNTATIKANETDPNTANNSASASTQVVAANTGTADLQINKYAFPDDGDMNPPFQQNNPFWYVLVIKNNGPSTAHGVTVMDQLPAGVTYNASFTSQGSCTQAAGKVTCNIGTINKGRFVFVAIKVKPTVTGSISNTATVSGNEADPNLVNNSSKVTITVSSQRH
jgi:uncharacterized repeat protein (TIGR01451 family)